MDFVILLLLYFLWNKNEGLDRYGKFEWIICNFWGFFNLYKFVMFSFGLIVVFGVI